MPHDIIDNQTVKLADSIRTMLPRSEAAHFAVGDFFLSGLEAVADVLGNVRTLHLLIGNTTNRETIEQIAEGYRRLDAVQRDLDAMTYPKRAERSERIAATAAAIGEDAKILDQSEQINDQAFYAIYQGQAGELEEEGDGDFVDLTEAEEMLRQLKESAPDTFRRITNLRDGIRCDRQLPAQEGAVVLCRAENFRQLYQVNAAGAEVTRDIGRILKLLQCEPDTPAVSVTGAHNRLVSGAFDRFAQEVGARWSEQKHTVKLTVTQRYVVEQLRLLYAQSTSTDLQRQITLVERAFTQPLTQAVKKELNPVKQRALTGRELLAVLENIYVRHNLDAQAAGMHFEDRPPAPQVVCSESLV